MQYSKFVIKNYRAIKGPLEIDLKNKIVPLVGINECGKTTILQAIFAFDFANDELNSGKHVKDISNLYALEDDKCEIKAVVDISKVELIAIIRELIKKNHDMKLTNKGKLEALENNSNDFYKIENDNRIIDSQNDIYSIVLEKVEDKLENNFQIELIRELSEDEDSRYRLSHKTLNRIDGYNDCSV